MDIERDDLRWAVDAGILQPGTDEKLWQALRDRRAEDKSVHVSPSTGRVIVNGIESVRARLTLVHVAWYAGAVLIMGALGWFATRGFDAWGGPGLLVIGLVYSALAFGAGLRLWRDDELKVLGGVLVAVGVSLVPLVVFAFERTTGLWPDADPGRYGNFWSWVKGGWCAMEVSTLVVGALMLWRVPFSFVAFPPALSFWFLTMDIAPLLVDHPNAEDRAFISVATGMVIFGVVALLRWAKRAALTFWLEIAALLAFQGGLMTVDSHDALPRFGFALVQLLLLEAGHRSGRASFRVAAFIGVVSITGSIGFSSTHAIAWLALATGTALVVAGMRWRRRDDVFAELLATIAGGILLVFPPYSTWSKGSDGDVHLALFALLAAGVVGLGVFERSRALVAAGAVGLFLYVAYLAETVFRDSMAFPLVLASVGIGILVGGVWLNKRRTDVDAWIDEHIPEGLVRVRPRAR